MMVRIDSITTKTGDGGSTGLADGSRVPKTDPRVVANGAVDELNSVLGIAFAAGLPEEIAAVLGPVRHDLFDLGADVSMPVVEGESGRLRIVASQVERLEGAVASLTDRLKPLTSFVLPGGTAAAAALHHARTVCRRAEVEAWRLAEVTEVNPLATAYLNRLSDLLFALARLANDGGRADVTWKPGDGR
ncbi:MAG: cob(I)yrinic acid a,c-diamide adenosyltransferase [Planctomycetota bacterium]